MLSTLWTITVLLSVGDARADAEAAAKKAAEADSYAFTLAEGPEKAPGKGVEGTYQKGRPVYFKADGVEFYRQGKALVYKQGGAWKRSKTGIESDPLLILGPASRVRSVRLPHEELAVLARQFKAVTKTVEKDGTTLYEGALTDAGVQKLVRTEHAGVAEGGTARLWADARGKVLRYQVTFRLKGRLGNAEIDGTAARSARLRGAGATRVEVPDEATRALR